MVTSVKLLPLSRVKVSSAATVIKMVMATFTSMTWILLLKTKMHSGLMAYVLIHAQVHLILLAALALHNLPIAVIVIKGMTLRTSSAIVYQKKILSLNHNKMAGPVLFHLSKIVLEVTSSWISTEKSGFF